MKLEDVLDKVTEIEKYIRTSDNEDEMLGRLMRLESSLNTVKENKKVAEIALELALIVAFIQEK